MNSKLSLVEAKNQARDEMEGRARKRAKEQWRLSILLLRMIW